LVFGYKKTIVSFFFTTFALRRGKGQGARSKRKGHEGVRGEE
jgi:hypothetical protein